MSHLVETMAYAHDKNSKKEEYSVPWHGLGVPVGTDLSAQEMREAAGLDWDVLKVPQYIKWKGKEKLSGESAVVRSSDGKILTHTSEDWEPVLNKEAFDFFHDFVEEGHLQMNTAGSLKDGKLVWALAKTNESFALFGKKDQVDSYLLFSNPHEYGKCLDIRHTNVRVVCNNTLTLALNGKNDTVVRLNHRQKFDAEFVKETMGLSSKKFGEYKEMAEFLAGRKFKKALLGKYFDEVFPSGSKKEDNEKLSRPAQTCLDSMDTQPGHEFGAGTWWAAFNSVTYNIDHTLGHSVDTRLQSSWYGSNRKKKIVALNKAVEYANA